MSGILNREGKEKMLELKISPSNAGVITETFKKINQLARTGTIESDTPVRVQLAPGKYQGILSYNLSNPLMLEGASGSRPEDILVCAENCEAFHKDTENRAVFVIGPGATDVTLKGFTIENTHIKTVSDASLGNQAEALCFNNQTGSLLCQNMRFISRQDTIHVKGFSCFQDCFVTGDVDYIWGYPDTSVWQGCTLHTREDNRGGVRPAYVLQSRALNSKPGFVFFDCKFTADKRPEGSHIWVGRSQGTGSAESVDRWDSIALVDCVIDENYEMALWTDEDGKKSVWPEKGSALSGWREFGTKIRFLDGTLKDYNPSWQEKHGYAMTKQEADALRAKLCL